MVEEIPAAVRAVEFSSSGPDDPLAVFVRKGEYRWRGDIVLTECYELDVPPFAEFGEGGWFNNDTQHWNLQSPIESDGSVHQPSRLRLTGEEGALLWGAWVAEQGSSGSFASVQLLGDAEGDPTNATVEVVNANFSFSSCAVRCVGGICLRVASAAAASLSDCAVGGVGPHPAEQSAGGVSAWDQSATTLRACLLTDGGVGSAAVRASNSASVHLQECSVERFFFGVALHAAASAVVAHSSLHNQSHAVFAFASEENQPPAKLAVRFTSIGGRTWAGDERPEVVEWTAVDAAEGAGEAEAEMDWMLGTEERLGRMTKVLDTVDPAQWLPKIEQLGLDGMPDPQAVRETQEQMQQMLEAGKSLLNVTEDDIRLKAGEGELEEGWEKWLGDDKDVQGMVDKLTAHKELLPVEEKGDDEDEDEDDDEEDVGVKMQRQRRAMAELHNTLQTCNAFVESFPPEWRTAEDEGLAAKSPAVLRQLREWVEQTTPPGE